MHRRSFLATVAAGWAASTALPDRAPLAGRVLGASHAVGHLLRGGAVPAASGPPERADIVIAGAGVSGLSAAWRLGGADLDVLVLDLEARPGGTSAWGEDGPVQHPWGAHYLPAPNVEARAAIRLLREIGAVTGWDAAGRPSFDPKLLCHAPEERIFYEGKWFLGLVPEAALSQDERDELARFGEQARAWTARRGSDGRPAFTIPIALSSTDPTIVALDRLTMAAWLDREGYRTAFLRWYVRYAMLDDFGGELDDVSAWAGLHYFASRKLKGAELAGSHFLVWPEGNGRLVKALIATGHPRIQQRALVTHVTPSGAGVVVTYVDVERGESRRVEARAAIVAAPAFVTRRLVATSQVLPDRASAPWIVANLHVTRPPDPDLPWDSVLHGADGLGYVDAGHQRTSLHERTVLTYFRAYGAADVKAARAALLGATWDDLASGVLRDLAPAHPELRDVLDRIDVMVWGHAMPRPRAGFLGDVPFEVPCALDDRIAWAHVDQSGMALFEEAQARGVQAAETVARAASIDLGGTWL